MTIDELDAKQKALPDRDSFRVPWGLLKIIADDTTLDRWVYETSAGNVVRAYRSTGERHDFVVFTINEGED